MAAAVSLPRISRSRRAEIVRSYASLALVVVIGAVILWQAVTYRGIIAVLAEWQFDLLGRYHPLLTYFLIMAALGVPIYLLRFVQKRSERRRAALPRRATRRAMRLARILLVTAGGLALASLVSYALTWRMPEKGGVATPVVVAKGETPPTGLARLEGEVVYDRITTLEEKIWFLGRDIRFVPVVAPGQSGRGVQLRYFVALPRENPISGGAVPREWTGTLRQGGLPGEIVRLYRYAGYRVEAPYYVLFTRPDKLTWSHRMLAVQFLIAALIALIGGLLQLAHARRMQQVLKSGADLPRPAAAKPVSA
jgi:hypothetical protein